MKKKARQIDLENKRRTGMAKITGYHSNIEACYRMIEQNEKMIKAVTEILKKDDTELLELQANHDYENDVACEEYTDLLKKANAINPLNK